MPRTGFGDVLASRRHAHGPSDATNYQHQLRVMITNNCDLSKAFSSELCRCGSRQVCRLPELLFVGHEQSVEPGSLPDVLDQSLVDCEAHSNDVSRFPAKRMS